MLTVHALAYSISFRLRCFCCVYCLQLDRTDGPLACFVKVLVVLLATFKWEQLPRRVDFVLSEGTSQAIGRAACLAPRRVASCEGTAKSIVPIRISSSEV